MLMQTFLVHQEHLGETDKLLRAFDLDYKYGPCVGIKRIDRWGIFFLFAYFFKQHFVNFFFFFYLERAHELELNPPKIIKDILVNDKSKKYAESLFHQFRMI